jgi:hypothetical protein
MYKKMLCYFLLAVAAACCVWRICVLEKRLKEGDATIASLRGKLGAANDEITAANSRAEAAESEAEAAESEAEAERERADVERERAEAAKAKISDLLKLQQRSNEILINKLREISKVDDDKKAVEKKLKAAEEKLKARVEVEARDVSVVPVAPEVAPVVLSRWEDAERRPGGEGKVEGEGEGPAFQVALENHVVDSEPGLAVPGVPAGFVNKAAFKSLEGDAYIDDLALCAALRVLCAHAGHLVGNPCWYDNNRGGHFLEEKPEPYVDSIFIPVNLSTNHWVLVEIKMHGDEGVGKIYNNLETTEGELDAIRSQVGMYLGDKVVLSRELELGDCVKHGSSTECGAWVFVNTFCLFRNINSNDIKRAHEGGYNELCGRVRKFMGGLCERYNKTNGNGDLESCYMDQFEGMLTGSN